MSVVAQTFVKTAILCHSFYGLASASKSRKLEARPWLAIADGPIGTEWQTTSKLPFGLPLIASYGGECGARLCTPCPPRGLRFDCDLRSPMSVRAHVRDKIALDRQLLGPAPGRRSRTPQDVWRCYIALSHTKNGTKIKTEITIMKRIIISLQLDAPKITHSCGSDLGTSYLLCRQVANRYSLEGVPGDCRGWTPLPIEEVFRREQAESAIGGTSMARLWTPERPAIYAPYAIYVPPMVSADATVTVRFSSR